MLRYAAVTAQVLPPSELVALPTAEIKHQLSLENSSSSSLSDSVDFKFRHHQATDKSLRSKGRLGVNKFYLILGA